ncbi:D-alanyl-D-alanine carboxypeptidase family protein [Caldicellulosiruptoraceae bacterium PP1]
MKKIICIIIILLLTFSLTNSFAENNQTQQIDIKSKSAILIDFETGKIIYEKNAHERLPLASITKVMTLLLICEAIENGKIKLDDTVTTSEHASSMGGSQVYLKEGEQMKVEELLKCVAVASANDAAVALAEHIAGSEQSFVYMMNKKAKELGMNDTNFVNACGLDADNHYSSAYDIAIMSRELLKHQWIQKYLTIWMDTIRNGSFGLTNTNRLVRHYKGTTGVKTGSTGKALFCVSASAKRNGLHLICVIMGANDSKTRFSEATKLLDYGFAYYTLYYPYTKNTKIGTVKVKNGLEDYVDAVIKNDVKLLLNRGEESRITKEIKIEKEVNSPVKKDQLLGKVEFYIDGKLIAKTDVIASKEIKRKTLFDIYKLLISLK